MSFISKVQGAFGVGPVAHPNGQFRKNLRLQGDFGRRSRLVLHAARFTTDKQSQAFKTFVTFRGYEVVEASHSNIVYFQRVSKVVGKRFDAETDLLRNEIENLHGDYEGFGSASLR